MGLVNEVFGWWKSSWGAFFILILPIILFKNLSSSMAWISLFVCIAIGIFLVREDFLDRANRRKVDIGRKTIVIIDGNQRITINKNELKVHKIKNIYHPFGNMFIFESVLFIALIPSIIFKYSSDFNNFEVFHFMFIFFGGLTLGGWASSMYWTRFMCFSINFRYKKRFSNLLLPRRYQSLFDME